MDQTTHNVRRANWLTIITQCQERPEGISVKQWLSDNGVKEKAYYYWLRKFRKEAYAQMQSPGSKENPGNEIAFTEILIPAKTAPSCISPRVESYENPVAVIRYNGVSIGISNEISDSLLSRILREVSHALGCSRHPPGGACLWHSGSSQRHRWACHDHW